MLAHFLKGLIEDTHVEMAQTDELVKCPWRHDPFWCHPKMQVMTASKRGTVQTQGRAHGLQASEALFWGRAQPPRCRPHSGHSAVAISGSCSASQA